MNIAVNPSNRSADLTLPAVFALGEAAEITISGLSSPDLNTLQLAIYTPEGTLLALCDDIMASGSGWTGTLDTRTTAALALFLGKRPDARIPVCLVMADVAQLWCVAATELVNNPFCIPSVPSPGVSYLTSLMFAGLTPLSTDTTPDEMATLLSAILERLQS